MTARVFVTLKKAVLDPQGKAVQRSLARLGFPEARRTVSHNSMLASSAQL